MIDLFNHHFVFINIEKILIEYNINYDDIINEINNKCKNTIIISTLFDINEVKSIFNNNIDNSIKKVFLRYLPNFNNDIINVFENAYHVGIIYNKDDELFSDILEKLEELFNNLGISEFILPEFPLYVYELYYILDYHL